MNRLARFSAILLGVLVAAVILVPMLAGTDPLAIGDVLATRLVPPGASDRLGRFHLLGTDRFGRDLFVRMMLAGRISLAVGVAGSVLAGVVGTVVGAVAAWRGGAVDRIAMAISDALEPCCQTSVRITRGVARVLGGDPCASYPRNWENERYWRSGGKGDGDF